MKSLKVDHARRVESASDLHSHCIEDCLTTTKVGKDLSRFPMVACSRNGKLPKLLRRRARCQKEGNSDHSDQDVGYPDEVKEPRS